MHRHYRHRRRRRGFGGFAFAGRFFGPGEVRLALLSLLSEGPRHGYELMRELEERSDGAYRASAGTIYPTLQQLEDEGLARSESRDGRRVYRLTEAGQREVSAHQEAIRRIWRRAEQWGDFGFFGDPDMAEVVGPALRLARAAARAVRRAYSDPEVLEQVREILDRARDELRDLGERRSR